MPIYDNNLKKIVYTVTQEGYGDFTSLSGCIDSLPKNLVALGSGIIINCEAFRNGKNLDTYAVDINGFVTNTQYNLVIETPKNLGHGGKFNSTRYVLWSNDNNNPNLVIRSPNIEVRNLIFVKNTNTPTNHNSLIELTGNVTNTHIHHNFFNVNGILKTDAIRHRGTGLIHCFFNTIYSHSFRGERGIACEGNNASGIFFNNTIINMPSGISVQTTGAATGTSIIKNNLIHEPIPILQAYTGIFDDKSTNNASVHNSPIPTNINNTHYRNIGDIIFDNTSHPFLKYSSAINTSGIFLTNTNNIYDRSWFNYDVTLKIIRNRWPVGCHKFAGVMIKINNNKPIVQGSVIFNKNIIASGTQVLSENLPQDMFLRFHNRFDQKDYYSDNHISYLGYGGEGSSFNSNINKNPNNSNVVQDPPEIEGPGP